MQDLRKLEIGEFIEEEQQDGTVKRITVIDKIDRGNGAISVRVSEEVLDNG